MNPNPTCLDLRAAALAIVVVFVLGITAGFLLTRIATAAKG